MVAGRIQHLVGIVFYDPEIDEECIVTRIEVVGRQRVIVAFFKRMNQDGSPHEVEDKRPIHVAEIESLLGTHYEERENSGEVNIATEVRPGELKEIPAREVGLTEKKQLSLEALPIHRVLKVDGLMRILALSVWER